MATGQSWHDRVVDALTLDEPAAYVATGSSNRMDQWARAQLLSARRGRPFKGGRPPLPD